MDIVTRAKMFAAGAHAAVGQRRKYTGEPYIRHPEEVAEMLRELRCGEIVQAAAYLHDVLEDTQVTLEDLIEHFGVQVARLVLEVTDVSKPENGNRAARKAIDRAHLALASDFGQTIKLADLISNTRSIAKHDPEFAKVYLKEKEELLKVLTKGNSILYKRAVACLKEAQSALET